MKVVIIGGVAGGASAAARLRRLDESAEIIMLEKGEYISFANCGLPYYVGGSIEEQSALSVQTPAAFTARFNVDVRPLSEAVAIDTDGKTVTVLDVKTGATYTESYDKLLLSPGASPRMIPGAPASERIFTIRTIPDAEKVKSYVRSKSPSSAVIAGGGFIALEMAENLIERGLDVTLVGRAEHVLANMDTDLAWDIHRHLRDRGLKLMTGVSVTGVEETDGGIVVSTSAGSVKADMLISALGVIPDTKLAADAGIKCDRGGYIITDDAMRTSVPDVYAVGDAAAIKEFVTGEDAHVALASPANKQARVAADQMCGIDSRYNGSQRSFIIKLFDKTAASTGITEKFARSLGIDCEKVHLYQGSHAGYYPGSEMMAVKVLFEKNTGKILGGQLFGGEGVDKRADILATAIRAGMTASDLAQLELCYAPPYSSAKDPVIMAGMAIENIVTGKVRVFHWEDLDKLDRSKVTVLDVRTEKEYEAGKVDGAVNIPLHLLRQRSGELDKSVPLYVHCLSGMRSYVACRILTGLGFDCVNISGGYRLYAAMKDYEAHK